MTDENQEQHHHLHHGLLPDLNGVHLVMSLSPKSNNNHHHHHHHRQQQQQQEQNITTSAANSEDLSLLQDPSQEQQQHQAHHYHHLHSTPFSVTDILSPIEESYRKLELAANPPSPYR